MKFITKTYLYNFDPVSVFRFLTLPGNSHIEAALILTPLKPHFYIVKLGFTGVYIIFLISVQKHRLWVLVRTASVKRSNEYPQSMF